MSGKNKILNQEAVENITTISYKWNLKNSRILSWLSVEIIRNIITITGESNAKKRKLNYIMHNKNII